MGVQDAMSGLMRSGPWKRKKMNFLRVGRRSLRVLESTWARFKEGVVVWPVDQGN